MTIFVWLFLQEAVSEKEAIEDFWASVSNNEKLKDMFGALFPWDTYNKMYNQSKAYEQIKEALEVDEVK
jgi:hypothetical protein